MRRVLAPVEVAPSHAEARWAVVIAAGLYLVGAALCACVVLLPHARSPAGATAVAVSATLTAFVLLASVRRRAGLAVAFIADLWGVVLIAALCASGGGSASPFALIYMFATVHAAAFQSRSRLYIVSAAALVGFLSPLAYESHVSGTFAAIACVGIVLALLTNGALNLALNSIREQRRRLQFLINASAGLDRSLDPAQTLRSIAAMAVPQLAEACVIDVFDDAGVPGPTVAAAADPTLALEIEQQRPAGGPARDRDPLERLLADALAHGRREGRDGAERAPGAGPALERSLEASPHLATMRRGGYVRGAAYPMLARGRTHGVISFWRAERSPAYDRGLLAVLADLSGRAALAYDNARLYAERAQVARTLRRSLMPSSLPVIPGLELASYFRPMGAGNEVGGDFYDVIGDRDGCWLIVGDVCGKGAEAAALTGFVRHTAAAYAREVARPGLVFSRVNRAMLEQDFNGCFATAILAHLCFRGTHAELTVAAAGHPAALLARADGEVLELGGSGTLLGVFPDTQIEEASTIMRPGDALALYTDGLTEAHAPQRLVSVPQMLERLRHTPRRTPQDAIDALLGLIDPAGGVGDDIAILAAQVDRRARPLAGAGLLN
jgi:hypothetical protein